MLEEIVDYIKGICLRHKAVRAFYYKDWIDVNQQNNSPYFQVVFENDWYSQWLRTQNVFTVTVNIDVLAFVTKDYPPLKAHSDTFDVANQILAYIDNDDTYKGILSIWDYSFMSLSKVTDDNAYGHRLTLELRVPVPVSLCDNNDNFNDEPYEPAPDHEIDIDEDEVGDLDISVITLPRDGVKC